MPEAAGEAEEEALLPGAGQDFLGATVEEVGEEGGEEEPEAEAEGEEEAGEEEEELEL